MRGPITGSTSLAYKLSLSYMKKKKEFKREADRLPLECCGRLYIPSSSLAREAFIAPQANQESGTCSSELGESRDQCVRLSVMVSFMWPFG